MKLQELLRKCDFDRRFEYIVKFHSKSEGSRFSYLVTYELLCDMEAEEGREYDIVPNPYEKQFLIYRKAYIKELKHKKLLKYLERIRSGGQVVDSPNNQ